MWGAGKKIDSGVVLSVWEREDVYKPYQYGGYTAAGGGLGTPFTYYPIIIAGLQELRLFRVLASTLLSDSFGFLAVDLFLVYFFFSLCVIN